jgi:hypothetical protein
MLRKAENNKKADVISPKPKADNYNRPQPTTLNTPSHKTIDNNYSNLADDLFTLLHEEKKGDANNNKTSVAQSEISGTLKNWPSDSIFLGVLSKCKIAGCDVHKISLPDFNIIEHYSENQSIPEPFIEARQRIKTLPQTVIAVLVYSDRLEFLQIDGTLLSGTQ